MLQPNTTHKGLWKSLKAFKAYPSILYYLAHLIRYHTLLEGDNVILVLTELTRNMFLPIEPFSWDLQSQRLGSHCLSFSSGKVSFP